MGLIERELERIGEALRERRQSLPPDGGESALSGDYRELYAAPQALSWALEPSGFKSPCDAIVRGTQADSGDCPESSRPLQS